MTGLWVLLGVLVAGALIGWGLRRRDGRIRLTAAGRAPDSVSADSVGADSAGPDSAGADSVGVDSVGAAADRRTDPQAEAVSDETRSEPIAFADEENPSAPTETPFPTASAGLPAAVAELLDPAAAVTLVQLSTTFCVPCRHARAVLAPLAERTAGLAHAELDLTDVPAVARALGVLRTPTTLALTADGRELLRVNGVPKADPLLAALGPHLGAGRPIR